MPQPCRSGGARAGRGSNHSRAAAALITGQCAEPWEGARRRLSPQRASTCAAQPRPCKQRVAGGYEGLPVELVQAGLGWAVGCAGGWDVAGEGCVCHGTTSSCRIFPPGSASCSLSSASAIFLMDLMELITAGRPKRSRGRAAIQPLVTPAALITLLRRRMARGRNCLSLAWSRAAASAQFLCLSPCMRTAEHRVGLPGDA